MIKSCIFSQRTFLLSLLLLLFNSCNERDSDSGVVVGIATENFLTANLVQDIETVPCTLSGGTKTECYKIVVTGQPEQDHIMGPWCPERVDSDKAGIWLDGGKVHAVDGKFISELPTFYNDDEWNLINLDGTIRVTDSRESCEGAAKPNVEKKYRNHCVQCDLDYLDLKTTATYFLPVKPFETEESTSLDRRSKVGVALNGVTFDPPAPVDAILRAHTIAPFDICGGHVNPHTGYHYHTATGCGFSVSQKDSHAKLIGYAMDGFGIHEMLNGDGNEPSDLDECRGHYDDIRGYHYHVASAGENIFIGCFKGEVGCVFQSDGKGETCDASVVNNSRRPGPPPIHERKSGGRK